VLRKPPSSIAGITPLAYALSGFEGATLGAATFTSAETGIIAAATGFTNWALASVAFEAGVAVGSLIEAAFEASDCDSTCNK
jgi:hypothetical protein